MASVVAAVLLLKDGGTIEGDILNPDEVSRKVYRIKTVAGLDISLDARLVEREQPRERDVLIEYNAKAPFTENTVENHHFWAKWCGERQLPHQAKLHWQQILELDPDHTDARQVLGYAKDRSGDWYLKQDSRTNRGFVQVRGNWKTRYQIEVDNILDTQAQEDRYWKDTIRSLYRRLPQSEAELREIQDPAAFFALREILVDERSFRNQVTLLRTIVRLPSVPALQFVTGWTIRPDEDTTEDVRRICIEELQKRINEYPEARRIVIDTYRDSLRSIKHPAMIELAARALGDMGGVEAVPELIDVLVLVQTEVIQAPQQGYSFGSGGSGISQGTPPPRQEIRHYNNQAALSALIRLTGVNFSFDQARWRVWYRQSQRAPSFDLRRG